MQPHTALYLVIVAAILQGAAADCNPAVAVETNGSCECKERNSWYNNREHSCQDKEDLFYFDGCGPFETNATGACLCKDGFIRNDLSRLCEDANTCSTTECESMEVCFNNLGLETCKCNDTYRRTSTLTCEDLNEALNPQWNDCPQTANNTAGGYSCVCFDMFNDTNDDGKTCILKPEYEDCSDSPGMICVREKTSGSEQRFVMQGFKNDTLTTAVDKNECEDHSDTNCWPNSRCSNLEDGAGYECVCDPGYTDAIFNDSKVKECVPLRCLNGEYYDCIDPCVNMINETNEVCVEKNPNCGAYVERLQTAIFTKDMAGNLFNGTLETWDAELPASQITASLEVVFGKDAAQASRSALKENVFEIEIVAESNGTIALQILQNYCLSLELMPTYCELPQGTIVKTPNTVLQEVGPCDANPCPETHTCNATARSCECKEDKGPTGDFFNNYEVCDVSADLLKAKDSQKVTAALLGTFLGLALVGIVVLVFFKKGQFFSS